MIGSHPAGRRSVRVGSRSIILAETSLAKAVELRRLQFDVLFISEEVRGRLEVKI